MDLYKLDYQFDELSKHLYIQDYQSMVVPMLHQFHHPNLLVF
jgi:hypothetical protein